MNRKACSNLERDLRDVQVRISELRRAQQKVKTVAQSKDIHFELSALVACERKIEGTYRNHKGSAFHALEASGC